MSDVVARVKKLKEIYDAGLITKEEFDAKRLAIIDGEVLSRFFFSTVSAFSFFFFFFFYFVLFVTALLRLRVLLG